MLASSVYLPMLPGLSNIATLTNFLGPIKLYMAKYRTYLAIFMLLGKFSLR